MFEFWGCNIEAFIIINTILGIPCKYSYNGPQNSILIIKAPYYTSLIIDTLKRSPLKELLIPILKAPIVGLSGLGSSMKKPISMARHRLCP